MRLLRRLSAYARILPNGRRNRTDALRYLIRRPALLAAIGAYETRMAGTPSWPCAPEAVPR
jgi:hypothetical protein